jgi:hypothetical protein
MEPLFAEKRLKKIVVLYLARGASPTEREAIGEFFSSYHCYSAGIDHELVVIIKGFQSISDLTKARSHWSGIPHTELDCNDDFFDLGAFTAAAKSVECDAIMALNTFSRIESSNWLIKLADTYFSTEEIGIVGCSASLGRHRLNGNFKLKGPNPHIRTNGFFIGRNLFLQMVDSLNFTTKESTLEFESGDGSITNRLIEMGYRTLLVGKDGVAYKKEEWVHSGTFALGEQENLLISDNQTSKYKHRNAFQRVRFTYAAWGNFNAFDKR